MDSHLTLLCKAGAGEHSPLRENHRNRYWERNWETRLGMIALEIPKLRQGSDLPDFLELRRYWEPPSSARSRMPWGPGYRPEGRAASWGRGVMSMSWSGASRLSNALDAEVTAFRERQLDGPYRYIWLDAMYSKVPKEQRVVGLAVLVAIGVGQQGHWEVLSLEIAAGEMESAWSVSWRAWSNVG